MRFLIVVSLFVGIALGSPIGQVEITTSLPQDLLRSDLEEIVASDATTVLVEVLADEVTVPSATDRARQAPAAAGGEDESNEDNEEDEPTTASPGGGSSGSGASSSSAGGRPKQQPAIPQPLANSSNFLAEYQFSSQFNLGPNPGELAPLVGAPVPAAPVPEIGQVAAASQPQPDAQAAQAPASPPVFPAAVPAAGANAATPLSAGAPPVVSGTASSPSIVAAGEDEDDAESDEDALTEAPSARLQQQQQQQIDAQRIEESDSDNEITNDDVTTVKSFAAEYEYTVQQLGSDKRVQS